MMAVGYGDIYPRSTSEMIYAIFAQTIGAMIFGLIIGTVSTVLETADARGSEIKRHDDEVTEWMRSRKLDLKLRVQIRNHFEYVNSIKSAFEERSILERLPVSLRTEVTRYSKKDIFDKVAFLGKLSHGFLHELLLEMRPIQLAAGEALWQHGNRCRYLYILRQGLVQYEVPTKDLSKWRQLAQRFSADGNSSTSPDETQKDQEKAASASPASGFLTKSSSPYVVAEHADSTAVEPDFTSICVYTDGGHFGNEKIVPLMENARAYVKSVSDFFVLPLDELHHLSAMFTDDKYEIESEAENRVVHIKQAARTIVEGLKKGTLGKGETAVLGKPNSCKSSKSSDGNVPPGDSDWMAIVHNGKLKNRGMINQFWPAKPRTNTELRFRALKRNVPKEEWVVGNRIATARRRKSISVLAPSEEKAARKMSVSDLALAMAQARRKDQASSGTKEGGVGGEKKDAAAENGHTSQCESPVTDTTGTTTVLEPTLTYPPFVVAEEDQFDLAARWIIFPQRLGKVNWDMTMAVLIVYSVAIIPYRICFNMDAEGFYYAFDRVVDVLFAVDMGLTFRTAYFRRDDKVFITVPSTIGWTYLKSWFFIDFLSTFPVDTVIMAIVAASTPATTAGQTADNSKSLRAFKLIRALRLIRLLKLARLLKLGKFIKSVEEWLQLSPAAFKLLRLVLQVTFIAHLLACFWYYMAAAEEDIQPGNWWNRIEHLADADVEDHYVSSLYWAFTTMTTVGYGDLTPQTGTERTYSIIVMILGATVFGYIVGNVSQMVGRLDVGAVRQREQLARIKNYMIEQDLPRKMRMRIERFFEFYYQRTSIFDENRILRDLPPNLRRNVVIHINRKLLRLFRGFFTGVNDELKMALLIALRPSFCQAFSCLYSLGDGATEIYFLQSGSIRIVNGPNAAAPTPSACAMEKKDLDRHAMKVQQCIEDAKMETMGNGGTGRGRGSAGDGSSPSSYLVEEAPEVGAARANKKQYAAQRPSAIDVESGGQPLTDGVRNVSAGQVFGFVDFVLGSSRHETAFAKEYTTIMVLQRTTIWSIVAGAPDLAKEVQHLLAKHLDIEDRHRGGWWRGGERRDHDTKGKVGAVGGREKLGQVDGEDEVEEKGKGKGRGGEGVSGDCGERLGSSKTGDSGGNGGNSSDGGNSPDGGNSGDDGGVEQTGNTVLNTVSYHSTTAESVARVLE